MGCHTTCHVSLYMRMTLASWHPTDVIGNRKNVEPLMNKQCFWNLGDTIEAWLDKVQRLSLVLAQ